MTAGGMIDTELFRLYGSWAGKRPEDAAALMADYPGSWWIAGGWAIELTTGYSRPHADLDVGVLRDELPLLRRHTAGRLDLWAAHSGSLTPILPNRHPDAPALEILPKGANGLWARHDAASPWEYDFLLSPGSIDTWVYRRDPAITMPLRDAVVERGGIPTLRPEIQLLYKARGDRPKDWRDLHSVAALLSPSQRDWLREQLERTLPGHDWIRLLETLH